MRRSEAGFSFALRAITAMIERERRLSTGQATMTMARPLSIAALSAAPLGRDSGFPDDFAGVASPVSDSNLA
jgi:hypothetical protein